MPRTKPYQLALQQSSGNWPYNALNTGIVLVWHVGDESALCPDISIRMGPFGTSEREGDDYPHLLVCLGTKRKTTTSCDREKRWATRRLYNVSLMDSEKQAKSA